MTAPDEITDAERAVLGEACLQWGEHTGSGWTFDQWRGNFLTALRAYGAAEREGMRAYLDALDTAAAKANRVAFIEARGGRDERGRMRLEAAIAEARKRVSMAVTVAIWADDHAVAPLFAELDRWGDLRACLAAWDEHDFFHPCIEYKAQCERFADIEAEARRLLEGGA